MKKTFKIYLLFQLSALSCTSIEHRKTAEAVEASKAAPSIERSSASQTERYHYDGSPAAFVDFWRTPDAKDPLERQDLSFLVNGLSPQRAILMENNLFDTGVEKSSEQDKENCRQLLLQKGPHRTAKGQCYYYGIDKLPGTGKRNSGKAEFSSYSFQNQMKIGDNSARFGRNADYPNEQQIEEARLSVLEPNPRLVSRELFTRKNGIVEARAGDKPVINVLAGAWLQAMNHDWFSHGKNVSKATEDSKRADPNFATLFAPFKIEAIPGDEIFPTGMIIPRTKPDLSLETLILNHKKAAKAPVTFQNTVTHWWDASQIYGSDEATIRQVRTVPQGMLKPDGSIAVDVSGGGEFLQDGKVAVDPKARRMYYNASGLPRTGFSDNWWVGLDLIHSLFAMEHNSVVEMLKKDFPNKEGDWYFEKARLIVSALIAKIHTVEWTPALLDNKALHAGMYSNWHGLKSALFLNDPKYGKSLGAALSWITKLNDRSKQAFLGLVGNELFLQQVPFSLTEEFVSVYRMHPLVPDTVLLYSYESKQSTEVKVKETLFEKSMSVMQAGPNSSLDMMYSFGVNVPGALTLFNYPEFMQNLKAQRNTDKNETIHMDLGAVDVLRDRERMVPRYNDFRRLLGQAMRNEGFPLLKPISSFEELICPPRIEAKGGCTDLDREQIEALKKVYGRDAKAVDRLDLLVGTLAEKDRYAGYAFGNTPFYIFAIMASRRLMADPYFNDYYTQEVYTRRGLNHINNRLMKDVILQHFPELGPELKNVKNAFQPWN